MIFPLRFNSYIGADPGEVEVGRTRRDDLHAGAGCGQGPEKSGNRDQQRQGTPEEK